MECGKVSQRVWHVNQVLKEWIGPLGREASAGNRCPRNRHRQRGCRIKRQTGVMTDSCTPVINLKKSQLCFI